MPLTSIVTVVLRILAISWFLQGLAILFNVAHHFFGAWFTWGYSTLIIPMTYIVGSGLLFMWSHTVARIVTPRTNSEVNLGTLTLRDLYSFAFVFLGLYFVLSSLADTLNWIHYAVIIGREPGMPDQNTAGFYELTRPLVTLLAGGACLIFAPRFARKVASIQNKQEAANK